MLTAQEVQTWIEGKLDGTHPEFGPVDVTTLASKDFVIFYPASTTVTSYGVSLCNGDQFNAAVTLPSGAVANYDAVAECSAPPGPNQVTFLAWDAVYGVTAQLGSPDPDLQPYPSNWGNYDTAHAAYQLVPATGNLQGACSLARLNWVGTGPNAVPILLDAGVPLDAGPGVTWSNNAAAGYHDPCIPDLPGPYFVSVPVTRDAVQVTTNPFTTPPMVVTSPGVLVPVGSAKTVDLQLLSDAPTSGPWTVSAEVLDSSGFTFAFDRTTGQNGDVLHLSITAPSAPQQGTAVVYSTLEGRRTFYVFPMESK
jgi:hypothetical protein